MKVINVYGCSWSHGIKEDNFESWVIELGRLLPDYQINNYALTGSSIAFSCWMLEKTFNADAISIFQCTMPGRFSYWKDFNLKKYQINKRDNVICFTNDVPVTRMLAGQFQDNDKKFHKEYYSRLTKELELIEWKSYVNLSLKKSSYVFTHRFHEVNNQIAEIDNIGNILGETLYKKYINDNDGFHFGTTGQKWQAEFIVEKLKNKKIL